MANLRKVMNMHTRKRLAVLLAAVAWWALPAWGQAKGEVVDTTDDKAKIVILAFECADEERGEDLANRVRMGLKKLGSEEYDIIDRYTIREGSGGPRKPDTKRADIEDLLIDVFGANVMVFGTLEHERKGNLPTNYTHSWRVQVRVVDLREGSPLDEWKETFTDNTERGAGLIAQNIYEKLTGKARWIPPQHGDVPEPKEFGKAKNLNSDFALGAKNWIPVDNVSTFIERDPEGKRGNILRMKNDFHREDWRDYRRKLMFGQASPARPPKLRLDASMGGLAGLEGCDIVSDYFAPRDGWRYWVVADAKGPCATKVFVKGWVKTELAEDGLSERSLIERKMTPQSFAKLTPEQRKNIITADRVKYPERYVREVWRYQIGAGGADWTHSSETFPPRGGLMKGMDYLHIKILTYWPPGTNYFDKVAVYEDPDTKAPIDEEKARTKGDKTFTGERK